MPYDHQVLIDELATCKAQIVTLANKVDDLMTRNQILRTRPDLPMTDPQKIVHKELERWAAKARECLEVCRDTFATLADADIAHVDNVPQMIQEVLKGR